MAKQPKLDALVLCQSIGTDEHRTRWDLQGVIRGRLESTEFPLRLPSLGVYLALTGMHGEYEFALEIVELATDRVITGTRMNDAVRIDDPLTAFTECIPLPAVVLENRGRYACRLLVNGALFHESTFDVDWPKPAQAQGSMSPTSFARVIERLKAKEPGLLDAKLAEICGVDPQVIEAMQRSFEGLDPQLGQEVLSRLCHHYRLRPEEFFEAH